MTMKTPIFHCAAALLVTGFGITAAAVSAPAAAQMGGIVHDPRNYAQNILTAARTLEQINNQIKQLQHQAQSMEKDRKSDVSGQRGYVSVTPGWGSDIKKQKQIH